MTKKIFNITLEKTFLINQFSNHKNYVTKSSDMEALDINQIITLGDSLTDNGNCLKLTGFLPTEPFFAQGRFSNGLVWTDYVANELGLNLVPSMSPVALNSETFQSLNFAVGGATSGSTNIAPFLPGLKQQTDILTGLKGTPLVSSDALYSLWIGANDYLKLDLSANTTKKQSKQIVQGTINNISNTLTTLIEDMDAQNIMVFNLPDLSQTPLGRSLNTDAAKTLQSLTTEHNKQLDKEIKSLSKTFSNVHLISLDIHSLFKDATKKPSNFGFANVTDSATNTNIYDPSFILDPSKLVIRENSENYLFWDSAHPTTKAHKIIADYVLNILESDPKLPRVTQNNLVSTFDNTVITTSNLLSSETSSFTSNPILINYDEAGQLSIVSSSATPQSNQPLEQATNQPYLGKIGIPVFELTSDNNIINPV